MSCDYKICGEAILRLSPDVVEAVESLRNDILGEDYVQLDFIDGNTLRLSVDYDDVNTVNTPDHVASVLDSIGPSIIGAAAFEITTGGESWTEWVGEASAIRKHKSSAALRLIEESAKELTADDIAPAVELLLQRRNELS